MSSCPPGGSWRARNPGPCSGRPPCPSRMPGGCGCGCTRCTAIRASRRSCWGSSTEARARAARGMSRNSRSTPACAMSTGWIRPGCSPTAGPGRWILTTTHPSSRASSPRTRCTSPDSRSAAELSSPPASSTARSACCQRRPGSGSYRRNARRTYWYGSASSGAVNSYGNAAPLSAVLRSWEDRFGATLVEVGFAEYRLLVRRPPRTQAAAEAAAAEIWAMCDEFWPTPHGVARTTVSEIAEYILDAPLWTLWLD